MDLRVLTRALGVCLATLLVFGGRPHHAYGQPSILSSCEAAFLSDQEILERLPAKARSELPYGLHLCHGSNSVHYYVFRDQYSVGYDTVLNVARWSTWRLDRSSMSTPKTRRNHFPFDTLLPITCKTVSEALYKNSGYDKGHLCPSEQRTATQQDNDATFLLDNVLPMTPDLNRKLWRSMERWCVSKVRDSDLTLLIVAGGLYHSNVKLGDPHNPARTITVPDSCFMVVLVLQKAARAGERDSVLYAVGAIMPNQKRITDCDWRHYQRDAATIQASAGFTFFPLLAPTDRVRTFYATRKSED